MTAKEHNRLVGIFLMAHGGLQAFAMIIIGLIYGGLGIGMLIGGRKNEEQVVGIVFIAMIAILAVVGLIFIIPQIIGGYKLWKEKANARTWGIVGSIISCLSFPLGTAAGVYGLWFLFGDEGKRYYLGGGPQPAFQNQPPAPPPPNSWQ
jgi:Ca2+/H+ antiporter